MHLGLVGIVPHRQAGAMDRAPVNPAEPRQPPRHVKFHRMPSIPRLPSAIDGDRWRPGRTFTLGDRADSGRSVTYPIGHASHPVPLAPLPIAMMPVMIVIGVVPPIMPVVAMRVPPAVVMEGERHAGEMDP